MVDPSRSDLAGTDEPCEIGHAGAAIGEAPTVRRARRNARPSDVVVVDVPRAVPAGRARDVGSPPFIARLMIDQDDLGVVSHRGGGAGWNRETHRAGPLVDKRAPPVGHVREPAGDTDGLPGRRRADPVHRVGVLGGVGAEGAGERTDVIGAVGVEPGTADRRVPRARARVWPRTTIVGGDGRGRATGADRARHAERDRHGADRPAARRRGPRTSRDRGGPPQEGSR